MFFILSMDHESTCCVYKHDNSRWDFSNVFVKYVDYLDSRCCYYYYVHGVVVVVLWPQRNITTSPCGAQLVALAVNVFTVS